MRDGTPCTVRLLQTFPRNRILHYQLELCVQGQIYRLALRYSAIRAAAKLLPRTDVKFPEPQHFASLFSQLTGNAEFFEERRRQMTRYFCAISNVGGLESNEGFALLLSKAEKINGADEQGKELMELANPPAPPQLRGKKLAAKVIEEHQC